MRMKTMNNVRAETPRQTEAKPSANACRHHWLIESASGPTSRGVCKVCGARNEFYNAIPEPQSPVKKSVSFTQMPKLAIESEEPAKTEEPVVA